MSNRSILFSSGCMIILALSSCGFLGPGDEGYRAPLQITYPIDSADSVLVQKFIDTNHLRLQVSQIALAGQNSRVRSLVVNLWWCDSSNTADTFVIPELICGLEYLTNISVENSPVKYLRIPSKGGCVSNVTYMRLTSNKLSAIPPNLSFFERLTDLRLDGNQIDTISTFNIDCPNLSSLGLQQNELRTIPDDIYLLPKLRSLYLGYNSLTMLPQSILQRDSLSVSIWYNRFCNVPDSTARILTNYDAAWKTTQTCD